MPQPPDRCCCVFTQAITRRRAIIAFGVFVALLIIIQLLPVFRPDNPPVAAEPPWDSPETRALAQRACFDCHSNETVWPWYARVAPVGWLVVHDVREGRETFNLSNWHSGDMSGAMAAKEIEEGEMPLPQYLWLHPGARLSDAEKQKLMDGLRASLK